MKKTLLSLATVIGVTLTASAETVELVFSSQGYENQEAVTEVSISPVTLSFDKGTNSNVPKYYDTGNALRLYGGNTMNVSIAPGYEITGFSMTTGSSNSVNAESTVSSGELSIDKTTTTWTGNAEEVLFTQGGTSGHVRIESITISYEATAPKDIENVKFSTVLNSENKCVEVSLSCATDGASIYYSLSEEGTPVLYTEPFALTTSGTVYAYAEKDGTKGETSSKNIIVPSFYSAFSAMVQVSSNGDEVVATGNYSVLYQNGAYLLITDGKSNVLVYGSSEQYEVGTKFSSISGTVDIYNDLFELKGAELTEGGEGVEYAPIELSTLDVLDVNDNIFDEVVIKNCSISEVNGKNAKLTLGDESANLYNTFGIDLVEGSEFEVAAFVWRYKENLQLAPVSITGGRVLLEPTISFSAESVEATIGTDFVAPTLTVEPADLKVSYSSSDESVATVDAEGNVTLVAKGHTVITATTEANDTYLSGSASYTLTVKKEIVLPSGYQEELTIVSFGYEEGQTESSYKDVEFISEKTGIKYIGNISANHGAIQMRSNNNNAGIVVTENPNKYPLECIYVEWSDATAATRTVNIYGSDSAYEAASSLYDEATAGELLGSFVVEDGDDYADLVYGSPLYFGGVRSNNGALYLNKIVFIWDVETSIEELENNSSEKQIFDLNGRLVNGNLEKGLYIVREGNKSYKMLVK